MLPLFGSRGSPPVPTPAGKASACPPPPSGNSLPSAGYTRPDGKNDEQLNRDLYAWLARPVPAMQADAATAKANFYGVRGLHGLVWEWVDDFNTAMVTGESRADSGLDRDLFCGAGSVGAKDTTDYAAFMRQALRSSLSANNTTTSLGFRCAKDLP